MTRLLCLSLGAALLAGAAGCTNYPAPRDAHFVHCFHHRTALQGHDTLDYFDDFQAETELLLSSGRRAAGERGHEA